MSKVSISLSNGRTIEWSGNREEGLEIIDEVKSAAKKDGETFDNFTRDFVQVAVQDKGTEFADNGDVCLVILAHVLQRDAGEGEFPGRYVDYLDDAVDFKFDIVGDEEGCAIAAFVRGKLHS